MKRQISLTDPFLIYFGTAPFLLGEVFFIVGLIFLTVSDLNTENVLGTIIFLSVGGFFVLRKVKVLQNGIAVLRSGTKVESVLFMINNTNIRQNGRGVKEYLFEYEVGGKRYTYKYHSAYKRNLNVGDRMSLYYLPFEPEKSIIPKLYNIYIY